MAQALGGADTLLLADDDAAALVAVADALTAGGANLKRVQLLGTGLWDNPRVYASAAMQGGLYAAPDPAGFRAFAGRYRTKFGQEPVRTAALAYDAVALVAALARTQGPQRFAQDVLTNPSGFAGIDGLFRFRADGTNERGLAVMRVASGGAQTVAAAPKSFDAERGHRRSAAAAAGQVSCREIGHHRVEQRETRHGSPAAGRRRRRRWRLPRRSSAMRAGSSAAAGQRGVALRIDAFREPQSHQQEFVGALLAVERVVGDDAVARGLDPHQPGFRPLFGGGGVAHAVDVEPAMGAGADAGIFVAAPVDQVVPAFARRAGRDWRSRRPAGRALRRSPG